MPCLIFPFCFSRLECHPNITATYSVLNIIRVLARVRIGSPPTGTNESVPLPSLDARPKSAQPYNHLLNLHTPKSMQRSSNGMETAKTLHVLSM